LLTRSHTIQLWHIYALTAIQATALAFDLPARQALVPNLLPRKDLANAFTLLSISSSVGSIAGPALSGLVIGYLGQEYAYFFNALSYLAIIGSLILMGPVSHEIRAAAHHSVADGIFAIKEGVQFIRKQPIILSSMILDFFATFFSSANTLLPYVAQDILHVGAIEYGWLSASQSIGSVFVGLIISQRTQIKRQGMLLLGSVFVFGVATIVFGLSRGFVLTMLALIVIGASDSVSTILRNTIRQLQTPDQLRGRMVSVNQIFFTGGPQLGEVEAGLVGQAFGIVAAIISGGIGCIAAVGLIAWRWPQLRNFTESELQPAR
jgi:MFS family permease